MTSVGGAARAIFGTFFRGGAENLGGRQTFNSGALSTWLVDGLDAVQKRGGAKSGDKTMVDALGPAARRSEVLVSAPLNESLVLVAEAAQQGMEDTKAMIPALGKARPLGERALGHRDPGAVSTYLLLKYMAEYVAEKEK
jgi:dihydroxyacetone kinase-like protein